MEDPVSEIPTVIQHLTKSSPSVQGETIDRYFTPSAAFVHPFCHVWSYNGSRWAVKKVYQWYKIMSPKIELEIRSVAYDEENMKLYVTMFQIFSIWLWPFHVAPVTFTSVLDLTTDAGEQKKIQPQEGKKLYYIRKQEDLYQTSEFIKFVMPHVGHLIVMIWHCFGTIFSILGVFVFWPVMWLEDKGRFSLRGARAEIMETVNNHVPESSRAA